MSDFRAEAEKKMKEWKAKAESNEKKIQNTMKAASEGINFLKQDQGEIKKKYMELQMKNIRLAADSKQNAKNVAYLQQQLISNRSAESIVVSEAMRLVGVVNSGAKNLLDQSLPKENDGK